MTAIHCFCALRDEKKRKIENKISYSFILVLEMKISIYEEFESNEKNKVKKIKKRVVNFKKRKRKIEKMRQGDFFRISPMEKPKPKLGTIK